jgi:hypothetical protein
MDLLRSQGLHAEPTTIASVLPAGVEVASPSKHTLSGEDETVDSASAVEIPEESQSGSGGIISTVTGSFEQDPHLAAENEPKAASVVADAPNDASSPKIAGENESTLPEAADEGAGIPEETHSVSSNKTNGQGNDDTLKVEESVIDFVPVAVPAVEDAVSNIAEPLTNDAGLDESVTGTSEEAPREQATSIPPNAVADSAFESVAEPVEEEAHPAEANTPALAELSLADTVPSTTAGDSYLESINPIETDSAMPTLGIEADDGSVIEAKCSSVADEPEVTETAEEKQTPVVLGDHDVLITSSVTEQAEESTPPTLREESSVHAGSDTAGTINDSIAVEGEPSATKDPEHALVKGEHDIHLFDITRI